MPHTIFHDCQMETSDIDHCEQINVSVNPLFKWRDVISRRRTMSHCARRQRGHCMYGSLPEVRSPAEQQCLYNRTYGLDQIPEKIDRPHNRYSSS